MRNYNQTSYDTIPRTGSNIRSRSQNHYYIQANEFQRRYQNSLINAYRLNSSRKCPPCCNDTEDREYQSNMTFRDHNDKQNQRNGNEYNHEYYETSHFQNQSEERETLANLQKSKRYLEELVEKSNVNFRAHKERTQQQIQSLQKLLQSRNEQLQSLQTQIQRLKKISLQTAPNGANKSYIKQDQTSLIEIQTKEKTIKQLQRKCSRLREENSYFRQDIEIKNKEIEQLKAKFKLKEENDSSAKKELEKEGEMLRGEKKQLVERILWLEKVKDEKERQGNVCRERINRVENQLEVTKAKFAQTKSENDKIEFRYLQKTKAFENQFRVLRQRTKQKDMQIEGLISKINCIQSELDFFKDKFTNLLFEIERQERESAMMYERAVSLKEEGVKFYEVTERLRQSELIELDSHPRSSRLNGFNTLQQHVENRLTQSIAYNRIGLGKDTVFQSLSPKHFNKELGNMAESRHQFIHKFPSMNMSISPIRTRQ